MLGIDKIARLAAEEARKEQIRADGTFVGGNRTGGTIPPNIVASPFGGAGSARKIGGPVLGAVKEKVGFLVIGCYFKNANVLLFKKTLLNSSQMDLCHYRKKKEVIDMGGEAFAPL